MRICGRCHPRDAAQPTGSAMTPINLPYHWPFPVVIANGKANRVVLPAAPPPTKPAPVEEAPF